MITKIDSSVTHSPSCTYAIIVLKYYSMNQIIIECFFLSVSLTHTCTQTRKSYVVKFCCGRVFSLNIANQHFIKYLFVFGSLSNSSKIENMSKSFNSPKHLVQDKKHRTWIWTIRWLTLNSAKMKTTEATRLFRKSTTGNVN